MTHAGCLLGVEARPVQVEVQVGRGLPGFDIVGLAERGVRESRVRVQSALASLGFKLPPRHLVVNLAPGDLKKTGAGFDLAIAVAILAACELVSAKLLAETLFVGELSLAGELRPTPGALAYVRSALGHSLRTVVLPHANAAEVALVEGVAVLPAEHLQQIIDHLDGKQMLHAYRLEEEADSARITTRIDLREVHGQATARRALEIAAVGDHHMLLVGSPGCGKTMLAQRLPTILPPLRNEDALEVATIASVASMNGGSATGSRQRPFRAPHHSATTASLIGGGDPVRPGEVTLAHRGVLFLDELPEFRRDALESLRTVLECGEAHITRASYRVCLPAKMLLIAAMNPCPCGYDGDSERICECSPDQVARYRARVSGPLLDRFDMQVQVPRLRGVSLRQQPTGESSEGVLARVLAARQFAGTQNFSSDPGVESLLGCLEPAAAGLLDAASERLGISARGYVKVLKVARSIANLSQQPRITVAHVAEAVQYRALDRQPRTGLARRISGPDFLASD